MIEIHEELTTWIKSNRPLNTTKTYNTYQQQFTSFQHQQNLPTGPLPYMQQAIQVSAFIQHLTNENKAPSTIQTAAAAVASEIAISSTDPNASSLLTNPLVKKTLQTAKKKNAKEKKQATPLTNDIIKKITTTAQTEISNNSTPTQEVVRDMTLILITQKACLRASEACALNWEDISFSTVLLDQKDKKEKREVMKVFVRKGKTDQERKGHTSLILQASDPQMCAIKWYTDYVHPLKNYRVIGRRNSSAPTPLIQQLKNDNPLSPATVSHIIKKWITKIGMDASKFSSHSCRRGGATEAARKGASIKQIMTHGNWKSDAVLAYIEASDEELLGAAISLT